MTFDDFQFNKKLSFAVKRAGFREPSPIQKEAIPVILTGKDVVGQAHTGTGKTAAFALPILEKMKGDIPVETLVIVPTRELATQVSDEFYKFSRNLGIRSATVYGGVSYRRQISRLKEAQVIVATPGRLLDLLTKNLISIQPRFVVLDEADEMLNMGFIEDIRRIFQFLEKREQTLMFSATISDDVKILASTLMNKPEFIHTEIETLATDSVKQFFYVVEEHERDDALLRLLESSRARKSIVFCRTKKEAERVANHISAQGFSSRALHGDIEQYDRQKIMKSFRYNDFDILVATDIAARGLDVRGVSHVINYHIPFDPESYVHRIGRTGRAKRTGVAMTLVTPYEFSELNRIKELVGTNLSFRPVPQKAVSQKIQERELMKLLEKESVDHSLKKTLNTLLKKEGSIESLSLKLISLLQDKISRDVKVGKTMKEFELLSQEKQKEDRHSSKKSSQKHSGRRHRRSGIRRGTNRGEVPVPKLKKIGSSRIVARKIY